MLHFAAHIFFRVNSTRARLTKVTQVSPGSCAHPSMFMHLSCVFVNSGHRKRKPCLFFWKTSACPGQAARCEWYLFGARFFGKCRTARDPGSPVNASRFRSARFAALAVLDSPGIFFVRLHFLRGPKLRTNREKKRKGKCPIPVFCLSQLSAVSAIFGKNLHFAVAVV